MKTLLAILKDESGAETVDYAITVGLLVVIALGVIGSVGLKNVARWTSISKSI